MFRQGGSNDVTLDRISRRADCWDNAPIERFFASLKKELVHDADFTTRAEVPGRRSSSPSRSSTITSGDPPRWGMCSRWRTSGKTVNPPSTLRGGIPKQSLAKAEEGKLSL